MNKKLALYGAVSACLTIFLAPAFAQIETVDPASVGLNKAKLEQVRQALRSDIESGRVPGAVMLVARKGKVAFYEASGHQTPEKKTAMNSKTIFRLYSMSKPIVSVAAMMLIERGQLRLDEPLSSYIPFFAEMSVHQSASSSFLIKEDAVQPAQQTITIRDVMRHTTGMVYGFFGGALGAQYKEAGIASEDIDLNEFSARLAKLPLKFEPGSAWHYGRSTDVLGRVIEVASGMPLDAFLEKNIFAPLGMVDTAFFQSPDKSARLAQPVKPLFKVTEPKPMLSGGGGLTSTMEDYLRFVMMLRNRGTLDGVQIIKAHSLALMTSNQIASGVDRRFFYPGSNYGFGLGFAVRTEKEGRYPGSVGDFWWRGLAGTYFWIDPRKDLFAIFMIQDPANRVHYTTATRNWVYGALGE